MPGSGASSNPEGGEHRIQLRQERRRTHLQQYAEAEVGALNQRRMFDEWPIPDAGNARFPAI